MNNDGVGTPLAMGYLHPVKDVETFVPAHAYGITIAETMGVEVGHENMETLLLMVETGDIEEVDGTVAPTMDDDGCGMAVAVEGIVGMMMLAGGHGDDGVVQMVSSLEAVEPGADFRVQATKFTKAGGGVAACRVGCQRIVEHIEATADGGDGKNAEDSDKDDEFLHCSLLSADEGTSFL